MQLKLECSNPSVTLTDENIFNFAYEKCINTQSDYAPGTVCAARFTFATDYSGLSNATRFTLKGLQSCDATWRTFGTFYVDSVEESGARYSVVAYDAVSLLDRDVSSFLQTTDATTLITLFRALSSWCGATPYNTGFYINASMPVAPRTLGQMTGRELMGYIAEAAGCYVHANSAGQIHATELASVAKTLGESECFSYQLKAQAPGITAVKMELQDGSVTVPAAGTAAELQITYNPLFYTMKAEDARPYVQNIYNRAKLLGAYYPGSATLHCDEECAPGNIITLGGKRYPIFTVRLTEQGATFATTGDAVRKSTATTQNTLEAQRAQIRKATDAIADLYGAPKLTDTQINWGLGYLGNANNTSLVSVIGALLSATNLSPGTLTTTHNLPIGQVLQTPYNVTQTNLTKTKTGDLDWDYAIDGIIGIVPTGLTAGVATFTVNGDTAAVYNIYPVNARHQSGVTYALSFPEDLEYDTTAITIYNETDGTTVIANRAADFSNATCQGEFSEQDSCLYITWFAADKRFRISWSDSGTLWPVATTKYYVY